MTAIALDGVTVAYGRQEVVHGVSVSVDAGCWLALVGPNGSGKSSTLRATCGLAPYQGVIHLDGASVGGLGRGELSRRVAIVPQRLATPAGMRVGTYVLLGRTPHLSYFGREGAGDREIAERLMRRLGVEAFAERSLLSLSGGELQLVALTRALAQQPSVLLLDEPTSSLDIGRQQEVMELIDELRVSEGLAIISAMHDLTQAGQYADQMLLLAGGHQVVSGPVSAVLTKPVIEEHYRATVSVSEHPMGGVSVLPIRPSRPACDAISDAGPTPSIAPTSTPVRPEHEHAPSLVLVTTGHGKGKSTAAFGVVMRAIARGWRVAIVQLIKSGRWRTGEEAMCRRLGADWWTIGDGFTWESDDLDRSEAIGRAAWLAAAEKIASGHYDVVVLDEITYAMNWGWISTREVVEAIRTRPPHVNIVATGRDAPDELVDVADTVTEMVNVRHAYDRGITARRGIDY